MRRFLLFLFISVLFNNPGCAGTEAMEAFQVRYLELKGKEDWVGIIHLGEALLQQPGTPPAAQEALIRNRLASCYFYLGCYPEALESAQKSLNVAVHQKDCEAQARALYLISAVHRVLEQKYPGKGHQARATESILLAMTMPSQDAISAFTRAKVYFNAGALAQDVELDWVQAAQYYAEALRVFDPAGDDYARTLIRQARCFLSAGKPEEALSQAESLRSDPNTRTGIHLLQLKAQIQLALGNPALACLYIETALQLAKSTGMARETELLEALRVQALPSSLPLPQHP